MSDPVVRSLIWFNDAIYFLRWPLWWRDKCGCEYARFWNARVMCEKHWDSLLKLEARFRGISPEDIEQTYVDATKIKDRP
jgi:hypothetical protein